MNSNLLLNIFKKAEDYVQKGLAKQQFQGEKLSAIIAMNPGMLTETGDLSNEVKLKFYGLYKVSTCGKNKTEQPGFFDFVGKAKWNAWNEVSNYTKEQAMTKYVELLNELAPEWFEFYNKNII
jgi:acyl-CoA-binding protein